MNAHRMKVLEMLKAGRISPEEAEQLLEKLEGAPQEEPQEEDVVIDNDAPEHTCHKAFAGAAKAAKHAKHAARVAVSAIVRGMGKPGEPRFFRIEVQSHDGDEVNVRLPFALLRAGVRLGALLPQSAQEAVQQSGVSLEDLAKLEGEALIDALREIDIEVQAKDGTEIHMYCE